MLRSHTQSHAQVLILGLVMDGRSFLSRGCSVLMDFSYCVRGLGLKNENFPRIQVYFSSEKTTYRNFNGSKKRVHHSANFSERGEWHGADLYKEMLFAYLSPELCFFFLLISLLFKHCLKHLSQVIAYSTTS